MKKTKIVLLVVSLFLIGGTPSQVHAQEQNQILLSSDEIQISEGESEMIQVLFPQEIKQETIGIYNANPQIVDVHCVGTMNNIAALQISYVGDGENTIAVYDQNNQMEVAYLKVNTSKLQMHIPSKLGTSKKNYCVLQSYQFENYDYKYGDFNDYKYVLKLNFRCEGYEDTSLRIWGCYGYFYDSMGNSLGATHLYAPRMAKGRTYVDEVNVPVNAVRFDIQGF